MYQTFRQEDRDVEHGSSPTDISEKLARLSTDDTSLTDWHLGFHIFLVSWLCLLLCPVVSYSYFRPHYIYHFIRGQRLISYIGCETKIILLLFLTNALKKSEYKLLYHVCFLSFLFFSFLLLASPPFFFLVKLCYHFFNGCLV